MGNRQLGTVPLGARVRLGRIVVGLAALSLVATGCPEDAPSGPTGPSSPTWTANHSGGPPVGGVTPWSIAIGTTAGWYAQFDAQSPLTAPTQVSLFPRTGPNGDTLGTPQVFPAGTIGLSGGALADHVLLTGANPTSSSTDLQWFTESGGVWSAAGSFALASGETIRGITDDVLVTQGWGPTAPEIRIYALSRSGGAVTATLTQSLLPPASWGPGYGLYWGDVASLDGDLLAIHAHNETIGVPDRVAVYRRSAGAFTIESSLDRADITTFGIRLAMDDGPGGERLVLGGYPAGSSRLSVLTYVSAGGTWAPEATIPPPVDVADDASWQYFGQAMALDGDVLVVTGRAHTIATPGPGGVTRIAYEPLVYRRGASGWTFESTLTLIPSPVDTDGLHRGLNSLSVSGSHIVGTNSVSLPGACSWCVSARFEAWRWDRIPA